MINVCCKFYWLTKIDRENRFDLANMGKLKTVANFRYSLWIWWQWDFFAYEDNVIQKQWHGERGIAYGSYIEHVVSCSCNELSKHGFQGLGYTTQAPENIVTFLPYHEWGRILSFNYITDLFVM